MVARSTIGIIVLALLLILSMTVIGLIYGGVIPLSNCPVCPNPGCNLQPNVAGDLIQCPAGFDTIYNSAVSVDGACDQTSNRCNRCIGSNYPTPVPGYSEWPNKNWADWDSSDTTSPTTTGKVMGYQGNIYVTDSVPTSSQCS